MKELNIQVPEGYEIYQEKSTFEKIVFKLKKKSYPSSYGEFCKNNPCINGEYYITPGSYITQVNSSHKRAHTDRTLIRTKEEAEAFLALIQLKRLWHEYVDNYSEKVDNYYYIDCFRGINGNEFNIYHSRSVINKVLFKFPSKELAEEFLNNFKDLFIKASPLWN